MNLEVYENGIWVGGNKTLIQEGLHKPKIMEEVRVGLWSASLLTEGALRQVVHSGVQWVSYIRLLELECFYKKNLKQMKQKLMQN